MAPVALAPNEKSLSLDVYFTVIHLQKKENTKLDPASHIA